MSKEHLWPDWMKELFPRTASDQHQQLKIRLRLHVGGRTEIIPTVKTRAGHASTIKVRTVCERCNTGWMSQMEDQTKPLLLELARGDVCNLDAILQHMLATWAAKTAMTAEFTDPLSVAIPQEHRTWLREKLKPPPGWKIWIARCHSDTWATGYFHRSFKLGFARSLPITTKEPKVPNTQTTTMGIGQLLIHIVSTTVAEIEFYSQGDALFGLQRVWPRNPSIIRWPLERILSHAEAELLADTLGRTLTTMPGVVWIPVE